MCMPSFQDNRLLTKQEKKIKIRIFHFAVIAKASSATLRIPYQQLLFFVQPPTADTRLLLHSLFLRRQTSMGFSVLIDPHYLHLLLI